MRFMHAKMSNKSLTVFTDKQDYSHLIPFNFKPLAGLCLAVVCIFRHFLSDKSSEHL